MSIIVDALACLWGALVAYLAAALVGGMALYVVTFLAVPVAAVLRLRRRIQVDDAIDRIFDTKPMGIIRDSRIVGRAAEEPSIMGRQYRWILSKTGFVQLTAVGAVFFVLAGLVGGAICTVPYTPPTAANGSSQRQETEILPNSTDAANPSSEMTSSPESKQISATVKNPAINVRAAATTQSRVLTTLQRGDNVVLIGRLVDDTWVRVVVGQGEGWIRTDMLSVAVDQLVMLPVLTSN